jgi:hypothetical protein
VKLTTHLKVVPRLTHGTNYTSTPPYVFMEWCLFKYRGNFTVTFYSKFVPLPQGRILRGYVYRSPPPKMCEGLRRNVLAMKLVGRAYVAMDLLGESVVTFETLDVLLLLRP